jgi:hypothetical protein
MKVADNRPLSGPEHGRTVPLALRLPLKRPLPESAVHPFQYTR